MPDAHKQSSKRNFAISKRQRENTPANFWDLFVEFRRKNPVAVPRSVFKNLRKRDR